jgi:hypothetical protein
MYRQYDGNMAAKYPQPGGWPGPGKDAPVFELVQVVPPFVER